MLLHRIAADRIDLGHVGGAAIAPVIRAHAGQRALHRGPQPRQRQAVCIAKPDRPQPRHREIAGFDEGVVKLARKFGMVIHQGFADTDQVHDRKEPGLSVIGLFGRLEVGKQADQIGIALKKRLWGFWRKQSVDFAPQQHVLKGVAFGDRFDHHALGQRQFQPFAPHAFIQRTGAPVDVVAIDAVFIRQDAAHPKGGGHLVFGHADPAPGKIGGAFDARSGAGKKAAMPESAADKSGDRGVVRPAARQLQHIAGHRHFGDVKPRLLHRPREQLGRRVDMAFNVTPGTVTRPSCNAITRS